MEEWRPIEGFPGYEISSHGRVRSFRRKMPIILSRSPIGPQKRGRVILFKDGERHFRFTSWLVLEAFVGPRPPNMHGAHDDGNAQNEHYTNLFWKTPKENMADRERHGRTSKGEKHYAAKLSKRNVISIRRQYAKAKRNGRVYGFVIKLAEEFGVTIGCIEDIIYGRKWKSVQLPASETRA